MTVSQTVNADTNDQLVDKFTWTISNVLDALAPIKTITTWRSTTSRMTSKSKRRKVELKWRTKLKVHFDVYNIFRNSTKGSKKLDIFF